MIKKRTKIISICSALILLGSLVLIGWGIQHHKKKISSSNAHAYHTSNFEEYDLHSKFSEEDLNNYFMEYTIKDEYVLYSINTDNFSDKINLLATKAFSDTKQFKNDLGLLKVYIDYYQKDFSFEVEIIWSTSDNSYVNNTTDLFYYDCFDLFID